MARKAADAAAPSPDKTGEAGNQQEQTAEQIAQEAADAQAMAEEEAKALKDAEDAKAQEAADAQAMAEEEAKAALVAEGWSLPDISEFPVTLQITNATPCKTHIVGTDVEIEAGATGEVTFETAKAYQRFTAHAVQIAELRGWVHGEGITAGVSNGED